MIDCEFSFEFLLNFCVRVPEKVLNTGLEEVAVVFLMLLKELCVFLRSSGLALVPANEFKVSFKD